MISNPLIHHASEEEIRECAAQARTAQALWRRYTLTERIRCVRKLWSEIERSRDKLLSVMHGESGAPRMELDIGEIAWTELVVRYYARHAHRILGDRHVTRPWMFLNKGTFIRNIPHGVAAIVAGRSFPLLAPFADSVAALIAGNAVLIKPSEWTTRTLLFLENVMKASGLLPEHLFQVVIGDNSTGLTVFKESDMLVFTGSPVIGKEMARLAAEQFKPVVLEMGGKHSMIVLNDAPLDRAAKAAVWGAFFNSGQNSVNVQRVFVESPIYQSFSEAVLKETAALRQSLEYSYDTDVGRLMSVSQLEAVAEHLQNARDKGARVVGGDVRDREHLLVSPALVLDATVEMKVLREETPGPVLAVMMARSGEEAIRLANAGSFGLAASIWSRDLARAEAWSAYLESGLISINDLSHQYAVPSLPFGGVKDSGLGRRHCDEGLRMFCYPQSVLIHEWPTYLPELWWFPYNRLKSRIVSWLTRST